MQSRKARGALKRWFPGEDSNLHEFLPWYLKPARLPVPPPGQDGCRTRGAEMYALPLCLSNKGAALWLGPTMSDHQYLPRSTSHDERYAGKTAANAGGTAPEATIPARDESRRLHRQCRHHRR